MACETTERIFLASFCLLSMSCATLPERQLNSEQQEYAGLVRAFPLSFEVSKQKAEEAWGRAVSWVGENSRMRIRVVSDYVVETASPNSTSGYMDNLPGYGYTVTRSPKGQAHVFNVKCDHGWWNYVGKERWATKNIKRKIENAELNAHILAHYIKSGEMPYPELIDK